MVNGIAQELSKATKTTNNDNSIEKISICLLSDKKLQNVTKSILVIVFVDDRLLLLLNMSLSHL